jgi:hypothetical protein
MTFDNVVFNIEWRHARAVGNPKGCLSCAALFTGDPQRLPLAMFLATNVLIPRRLAEGWIWRGAVICSSHNVMPCPLYKFIYGIALCSDRLSTNHDVSFMHGHVLHRLPCHHGIVCLLFIAQLLLRVFIARCLLVPTLGRKYRARDDC